MFTICQFKSTMKLDLIFLLLQCEYVHEKIILDQKISPIFLYSMVIHKLTVLFLRHFSSFLYGTNWVFWVLCFETWLTINLIAICIQIFQLDENLHQHNLILHHACIVVVHCGGNVSIRYILCLMYIRMHEIAASSY